MHPMQNRLLTILLILASLLGYLEWGGGNHVFLFEAEADILGKLFSNFGAVAHPLVLLPMLGQLLLGITLFQREPNRTLTVAGIACMGLLLGFMLFIGLFGLNSKILLSVLPFWFLAGWMLKRRWKA